MFRFARRICIRQMGFVLTLKHQRILNDGPGHRILPGPQVHIGKCPFAASAGMVVKIMGNDLPVRKLRTLKLYLTHKFYLLLIFIVKCLYTFNSITHFVLFFGDPFEFL